MPRRGGWLADEKDADDNAFTYEQARDHGFWALVDSTPSPYSGCRGECETAHLRMGGEINICGDWKHRRTTGCLAARSDSTQCHREAIDGVPFCEFHFGDAWRVLIAFVNHDRRERLTNLIEFERDSAYAHVAIDVAMVADAKATLTKQPERVYFFAAGHAIKIGRSVKPLQRVRSLTGTKAPADVDVKGGALLGTIPGGHRVEGALHAQFAQHRLVGEWFALDPIRTVVESVIAEFSVKTEQDFLRRQVPEVSELVEQAHEPTAQERKRESLRLVREDARKRRTA